MVTQLAAEGFAPEDIHDAIDELDHLSAIHTGAPSSALSQPLPAHFPLETMVMNLTNQCNLSCQYCYEFGRG